MEGNAEEVREHRRSEGNADEREPEVMQSPILERKAEEILLPECWGLVFLNLNPEDMLSCRVVCKTFNQLLNLSKFKVQWKFNPILPILFPYLTTSNPVGDSWEHVYNARLTCKSWRHTIDRYMSEGQSFFLRAKDQPLLTSFGTSEDIEKFQQTFGGSNTNPFPSRSVYVKCLGEDLVEGEEAGAVDGDWGRHYDAQNAYIEKAGGLLEQFGKYLYTLRLYFHYDHIYGPGALTLCKLVKSVSTHLPNLREFLIWNDLPEEEDNEASSYVAGNALAPLPKLQALSISANIHKKVKDYLLDAFGQQLTHLDLPLFKNHPSLIQIQNLRSVRMLKVELCEDNDTLESLQFLPPRIRHLKLTCQTEFAFETWNVDKALRSLRYLPIQLLYIQWGWDRVIEAGIDLEEYNNASIKTLIIHFDLDEFADGHQISFNFLQALSKLENLEFKFSESQLLRITHPEEVPEVVKLNEYLFGEEGTDNIYRIYDSNVWEKVPSLKTITSSLIHDENENTVIKKTIFTRENYDMVRIVAEEEGPERN